MLNILLESFAHKIPASIAPLHKTEALHLSSLQHDQAQVPGTTATHQQGPPSTASFHTERASPWPAGSPPPIYPSDRSSGRSTSPDAWRSGNPPSLRRRGCASPQPSPLLTRSPRADRALDEHGDSARRPPTPRADQRPPQHVTIHRPERGRWAFAAAAAATARHLQSKCRIPAQSPSLY